MITRDKVAQQVRRLRLLNKVYKQNIGKLKVDNAVLCRERDHNITLAKDLQSRLHRLLRGERYEMFEPHGHEDVIEYRYRISKTLLKFMADPTIAHEEAVKQICESINQARKTL